MRKILFVEDEKILQKTLGERLKEKGYDVISALNGEEGVFLAKECIPDLILLDIMLPLKNGLEVLAELKEIEETKEIPVIILTNVESAEEIEKSLQLGATTYLVKTNYHLDEVIDKIELSFKE